MKTIKYIFEFKSGEIFSYSVNINEYGNQIVPIGNKNYPEWTSFKSSACIGCKVASKTNKSCPVFSNIYQLVQAFDSYSSYDIADITVITDERMYFKKDVSAQVGLSSLFGLIMSTSGCGDLDFLRPMARHHLPFATREETSTRAIAMYLIAMQLRRDRQKIVDDSLDGLKEIYQRINVINRNICKVLNEVSKSDASVNAVVLLDLFTKDLSINTEKIMQSMEKDFYKYIDPTFPVFEFNPLV